MNFYFIPRSFIFGLMLSEEDFLTHYHELKHKVFSFFYYRLNNDTQLAEDMTSETFCKAFEKKDQYNINFAVSTWIFTIARNHLTDYFRKNETKKYDSAVDIDDANIVVKDEPALFWKKDIDHKFFKTKFESALTHLSNSQKEVLLLKYLDDQSNQEIAQIMDITVENVRQNHSRGLKKIKPLLKTFIEFSTLLLLLLI